MSHLEGEDFADTLALISHAHRDMQEKTGTEAGSVGLGVNQPKFKVMRMNARSQADVIFKEKPLENILDFKYLGSFLTADGGIEREVLTRIALASAAFQRLRPMLNSRQMPPPPSYGLSPMFGQSFYTQQR